MIICSSFSFLMFEENCSYDMSLSTCLDELPNQCFNDFWGVLVCELFSYVESYCSISLR